MPPSLPCPDSFIPPNGVSGVDTATELTPTMPDWIASPMAAAVPLAASHHAAAALFGIRDEALHRLDATRVGHRPHRHSAFKSVAEFEPARIFRETRQEFLVGALLHIEARRRDADLAGIAILEGGDGVGGLVRVRIREHHDRGMAAQFHGRALHSLGRERSEVLADRNGAGE